MVKKNRNRRNKRGGWIGSEWFDSLKNKISSAYYSIRGSPDNSISYTPATNYESPTTNYESPASYDEPPSTSTYDEPQSTSTYESPASTYDEQANTSYGGRRRRRRKTRKMRGGYSDNISLNNLAANASPFSGSTVRAHSYVGGRKTKRRCHKHKKSHRRHCRK